MNIILLLRYFYSNNIMIVPLLIAVIMIIVVFFSVGYEGGYPSCKKGAYDDVAKDILKIIKPYMKTKSSQANFEEYLEDYFDYSPIEIRKAREKSKKLIKDVGKQRAYLYYLLSDIVDNNRYDNAYEMLYDASVDASSFVNEDDKITIQKMSRKYTKSEETMLKKIFKKMDLDISLIGLRRFLRKNKYFMKKGRKTVPDTIALMSQAWNFFEVDDEEPDVIKIRRKPKLRKGRTLLAILQDERKEDLYREKEQLRREKEQLQREKENEKQEKEREKLRRVEGEEILRRVIEEGEKQGERHTREQLNLKKKLFKQHLMENNKVDEWMEVMRNDPVQGQAWFDNWQADIPTIHGQGEDYVSEDQIRIELAELFQIND